MKTKESEFFITGLALLFIALKLCHVINWSWIWVLSPILIPLSMLIFFGSIIALIALFGIHS